MAVAYDSANGASGTSNTASVSLTCAANSIAIVGVQLNGGPTVSSATFDGNAMSPITSIGDLYLYRYHGHASGSRTAQVVRSDSGLWAIGVMTFTGFDTGNPIGTFQTGTSTDPATSVETAAITSGSTDWMIADVALLVYDAITAGTDQTRRVNLDSFNSGFLSMGMSHKTGAASTTTMSWSATSTFGDNSIIGVGIRPAAAGGSILKQMLLNH